MVAVFSQWAAMSFIVIVNAVYRGWRRWSFNTGNAGDGVAAAEDGNNENDIN